MMKKLLAPLKIFKSTKLWAMICIVCSYILTYLVPILLLYFSLKDDFVREIFVSEKVSWSYIGFVIVASVFMIVFAIKVGGKLVKAGPSIIRYIFFIFVWGISIFALIYLLYKLNNFSITLENNVVDYLTVFRGVLHTFQNGLLYFFICIFVSNIFKIIAVVLNKEFVKALNWI